MKYYLLYLAKTRCTWKNITKLLKMDIDDPSRPDQKFIDIIQNADTNTKKNYQNYVKYICKWIDKVIQYLKEYLEENNDLGVGNAMQYMALLEFDSLPEHILQNVPVNELVMNMN